MKKVFFLVAVALMGACFTSCDDSCSCTVKGTSVTYDWEGDYCDAAEESGMYNCE